MRLDRPGARGERRGAGGRVEGRLGVGHVAALVPGTSDRWSTRRPASAARIPMTRSSAWAVVPSTCPASSSKSAARESEVGESPQDRCPGPVHRAGREPQGLRLQVKAESLEEGRGHGLILTPERRAQHAAIRRHDAEVSVSASNAARIVSTFDRITQDGRKQVGPPRTPGSREGLMRRTPGTPLRVDLEDQLVAVDQPGVDELGEWPQIAAAVLDIEDDAAPDLGHPCRVQHEMLAGRVGDEEVEGDRDGTRAARRALRAAPGSRRGRPLRSARRSGREGRGCASHSWGKPCPVEGVRASQDSYAAGEVWSPAGRSGRSA